MQKQVARFSCLAALLLVAAMALSCRGPSARTTATPNLTAIYLSQNAQGFLLIGLTRQFTARAAFDDGSSADVTSQVTWTTSNPDAATISKIGTALGLNAGNTQVTASWKDVTSQPATLEVTGIPMLEVLPYVLPNMTPGKVLSLQSRFMKSDGTWETVFADAWSSSDNRVATVSPRGLVGTYGPGTTDITVTYKGYRSRPTPLTVVAFSSIAVVPGGPLSMRIGSTTQLAAVLTYPDGKTEDVSAKATWRNTNMQATAFASPGVLVASGLGYTVVQATWQGITSDPVSITVTD